MRATVAGIRRDYATAGERSRTPRAPLLTADIVAIVAKARAEVAGWADEVLERRDTAILLLGYAGALRRSELVGAGRCRVRHRRPARGDPAARHRPAVRRAPLPRLPPAHRRERTAAAGDPQDGNLSITPLSGAVHQAIRRRAQRAGYDPELVARLGGHSPRAGFVTQAYPRSSPSHRDRTGLPAYQTHHSRDAQGLRPRTRPLINNAVTNLRL